MNNFLRLLLLAAAVLTLTGCSKATNVQFDTLVNNLSRDFPALWRLSTGFAYLMGVGFMMRGIYKMKQYGDMSTMMSASRSLKEPVTLLVVGAALMFFPTTKAILLTSTFGYG